MSQPLISLDSIADKAQTAQQLALQYNLPYQSPSDTVLFLTEERLELRSNHLNHKGKPAFAPFFIDFIHGKANHRRHFGGGKGQDIAKAMGLHKYTNPHVLDLTAGLGRDAFVLATLGCNVTLLERSAPIYLLLNDAIQRGLTDGDDDLQAILQRMTLHHAQAATWLEQLTNDQKPTVIYFDPMFPNLGKSAKVKQEMQHLHQLVGRENVDISAENQHIVNLATTKATKRIVVKRAKLAPSITPSAPNFNITGKSTRYDIYLPLSN